MSLKSELMALGIQPGAANQLGVDTPNTALTGAGTVSTDALLLTSGVSQFTTVASGSGARLPPAAGQGPFLIVNGGANALLVYPASGEKINYGTATTGTFSVTNAKTALFYPIGSGWIGILSA